MNKKGFFDYIYLVVFIVVGFIALIVYGVSSGNILEGLNSTDVIANNSYAQDIMNDIEAQNDSNDGLFVIMVFGLVVAILITLYYLRSSPAFFIIGLIGLVVVLFLAIFFKDVFNDVINASPEFSDEADNLDKSSFLFEYLPVFILIVVSVFLIILYVRKEGSF